METAEARFAFTAQYWGNGAVVCRAVEDRPGPVVEPQFGEFPTWTQALDFANKLNEGLDLDPREVRRIVTSSVLATACVLQTSLNCRGLWSTVQLATRAAHLRFVKAETALAINLCRSVFLRSNLSPDSALRVLWIAEKAFHRASRFLSHCDADDRESHEIAARVANLAAALQTLVSRFHPSSTPQDDAQPWQNGPLATA